MIKKIKSFYEWALPYAIPLAAGAIQVFSYAPYRFASAAFVSMAILLYSLNGQSPKQGFIRGWLFGLGLFGFGASWIYVSVYRYGGESLAVSLFITLGFVFILALFTGLFGWILNKYWKEKGYKRTLFAFPAVWVLIEIFRGWFLTGFPWLYLGYSQFSTHLVSLATIGSVWLVSLAVAFISGILYEVFYYASHPKKNRKYLYSLIAPAIVLFIGSGVISMQKWTTEQDLLTVAMIQGNIPQQLRWDNTQINHIAGTYGSLTASNMDVDLIIWPESAIPVPLPGSTGFFQEMSQLAASQNTGFVAGVPVQVEDKNQFYNAMVSMGQGQGVYFKKHLVPFGEYVPLDSLLRGVIEFFDLPMSAFVVGPSQAPLTTKGYTIAPAICYEIAYPLTMRAHSKDADMIVTISNDAWFGDSFGPKQHLDIAKMRAIESGMTVLRATNSGITAIIDHKGEIKKKIPSANFADPNLQGQALVGSFQVMSGRTPWLLFGPWLLLGLMALMLVSSKFSRKKNR